MERDVRPIFAAFSTGQDMDPDVSLRRSFALSASCRNCRWRPWAVCMKEVGCQVTSTHGRLAQTMMCVLVIKWGDGFSMALRDLTLGAKLSAPLRAHR